MWPAQTLEHSSFPQALGELERPPLCFQNSFYLCFVLLASSIFFLKFLIQRPCGAFSKAQQTYMSNIGKKIHLHYSARDGIFASLLQHGKFTKWRSAKSQNHKESNPLCQGLYFHLYHAIDIFSLVVPAATKPVKNGRIAHWPPELQSLYSCQARVLNIGHALSARSGGNVDLVSALKAT